MASIEMETLKAGMKMMMEKGFAPKFDGKMNPVNLRNIVQSAQERMPSEPGVEFIPVEYNKITGEINRPENHKTDYIIIYVHGGGLICGNAFSSRGYASVLATETGRDVYTLDYRLCPENPYPAPLDDTYSFYTGVVAENPDTPIYLIGESGGGYLSLATAMKARDEHIKAPAGIVPYSAPIDLYGDIDRNFEGNKDFTVTLDGLAALGELFDPGMAHKGDKYACPYLDDFKNLPPMLLAWDESESLAVDQQIIVDKVLAAEGKITYKSYPDCFHAFATAARGTEESRDILKDTVRFFEEHK